MPLNINLNIHGLATSGMESAIVDPDVVVVDLIWEAKSPEALL
jgi:hypothetical protein